MVPSIGFEEGYSTFMRLSLTSAKRRLRAIATGRFKSNARDRVLYTLRRDSKLGELLSSFQAKRLVQRDVEREARLARSARHDRE